MRRVKLNNVLKNYFELNNEQIKNVVIDSRKIEKDDLFIAIRGGNSFVNEALEKGAYVVFDDENLEIKNSKAFYADDSIEFLQKIAYEYRKTIETKIISITGSNGKTTTKDIAHELLGLKYKGKKTEGNLNNHIGLPLTLLRVEDDDEYMVLEMGMSGFGEIKLLSEIALPDYAMITNIGDSHLEYLISRENVFKAKTEVIPYIKKKLIVNGDDEFLKDLDAIKSGRNSKNDLIIKDININETGTKFQIELENETKEFQTNLIGEHNIYNIAMALLLCREFGIKLVDVEEKLMAVGITGMRFEIIEKNNLTFINDAYNASPVSMKFALETYSKLYNDQHKIVVLGDMLELGKQSQKMHEGLAEIILKSNIDEVYLFGKEMESLFNKLKGETGVLYFNTRDEISEKISENTKKTAVLLKGSRGMKLEQIIR